MAKVEALRYGDRKVYTVGAFNRGVGDWISRLPTVWIEGEVTELRRHPSWANVFFTLKDPTDGACLPASIPRGHFDALRLDLQDGERAHVYGRPELFAAKGEFRLRALTIERFGEGDHLAALERLKKKLAAEGLFANERKRPLPFLPSRIGLVTGNDAAAKRDVITALTTRFPAAHVVVAETYVQGPRAAAAMVASLEQICEAGVDVVVLARGGGSFDDLLPFSDERLVRAVAACPVPIVTAVGHEQDTPLCDLAADVRASTPTAAGRLVVPDLGELTARLAAARERVERATRRRLERERERSDSLLDRLRRAPELAVERSARRIESLHDRLRQAPLLLVERKRAGLDRTTAKLRVLSPSSTLARGYAIVRGDEGIVRSSTAIEPGARVDVQLAEGAFGARVEETR